MDNFSSLYNFIDFARANRKYAENTANNLKSALKIFEKELNLEEKKSINLVENRIEEIFKGVVLSNKLKSIESLNTYKARLIKVINDYKRYGADPSKIQNWIVKTKKFTPLLSKKDKADKNQISLSDSSHTPVHKIELALQSGEKAVILIPKNLKREESETIKKIIDSLAN